MMVSYSTGAKRASRLVGAGGRCARSRSRSRSASPAGWLRLGGRGRSFAAARRSSPSPRCRLPQTSSEQISATPNLTVCRWKESAGTPRHCGHLSGKPVCAGPPCPVMNRKASSLLPQQDPTRWSMPMRRVLPHPRHCTAAGGAASAIHRPHWSSRIALPIITSFDVLPISAPAASAKLWPAAPPRRPPAQPSPSKPPHTSVPATPCRANAHPPCPDPASGGRLRLRGGLAVGPPC
ncbi:hypothetical protein SCHAM137S_02015 [Streptomyces chartreusis]